ncbi:MAG: hypothetical protein DRH08_10845 [Deltaproteobacteria bacterium]|nr:MAG: hypothetical protein DRH08_10845 [Deltaproteobacteria bacterium]
MRHIFTVLAGCLLAFGAGALALAKEPPPALDFAVVVVQDTSSLPDSLQSPLSWTQTLFGLSDIEEYELATHTVRLKAEAVARISELPMWSRIERWTLSGTFYMRVDGDVVYEGQLFSIVSSAVPPAGPTVFYPFIMSADRRTLTIRFSKHIGRETNSSDLVDRRNDDQILGALRAAGVLVE